MHDAGNSSFHLPRGVARDKNCDTLCGIFRDDAFAHLHHSFPNLPNLPNREVVNSRFGNLVVHLLFYIFDETCVK